jgi:hypothetical protein
MKPEHDQHVRDWSEHEIGRAPIVRRPRPTYISDELREQIRQVLVSELIECGISIDPEGHVMKVQNTHRNLGKRAEAVLGEMIHNLVKR